MGYWENTRLAARALHAARHAEETGFPETAKAFRELAEQLKLEACMKNNNWQNTQPVRHINSQPVQ